MPQRKTSLLALALLLSAACALPPAAAAAPPPGHARLYVPAKEGPLEVGEDPAAIAVMDTEGEFDDLLVSLSGENRLGVVADVKGKLLLGHKSAVGFPPLSLAVDEAGSALALGSSPGAALFELRRFSAIGPVFAQTHSAAVGVRPSAVIANPVSIEGTAQGTLQHEDEADFVVADRRSDDLALVRTHDGRPAVIGRIPVGDAPVALVGEPGGSFWVANSRSGTITWLLGTVYDGKMFSQTAVVGGEPAALAVGNFVSGDYRDTEVAVVDREAEKVAIVDRPRQVPNQPFEPYRVIGRYPVGRAPTAIFAADLDEHPGLDLAVVNSGSDNVSLLLNRGSGRFIDGGTYATGRHPVAVAPILYGRRFGPDLAIANRGSDNLTILVHQQHGECRGGEARLRIGTPGRDSFGGTDDPEESRGRGGDDRIAGSGAADCLWGEEGDDYLIGNRGPDLIWPGPGDDAVSAGSGRDRIFAVGDGADEIWCEDGIDTVYADPGDKLRECERTHTH